MDAMQCNATPGPVSNELFSVSEVFVFKLILLLKLSAPPEINLPTFCPPVPRPSLTATRWSGGDGGQGLADVPAARGALGGGLFPHVPSLVEAEMCADLALRACTAARVLPQGPLDPPSGPPGPLGDSNVMLSILTA